MTNIEQIEDYLTNRLGPQEKLTFEQQLASDPSLKADLELQKQIIEGVRNARRLELKAMLNQVPVAGSTSAAPAGKILATAITAGIVTTMIYLYVHPDGKQEMSSAKVSPRRQPAKEPANIAPDLAAAKTLPSPASTPAEPKEKKINAVAETKPEPRNANPANPMI
jgi:hypothetical protein